MNVTLAVYPSVAPDDGGFVDGLFGYPV